MTEAHEHHHGEADYQTVLTGLLITRRVEGEVTAVFDMKTALAAGAACGLTVFLLGKLFGR
jgi:hypothetical protein